MGFAALLLLAAVCCRFIVLSVNSLALLIHIPPHQGERVMLLTPCTVPAGERQQQGKNQCTGEVHGRLLYFGLRDHGGSSV